MCCLRHADLIHTALPYVAESKVVQASKGLQKSTGFLMGFASRGQEEGEASRTWDKAAVQEADELEKKRLAEQAKELGGWQSK